MKQTITAIGTLIYEPERTFTRDNGKVVHGRKRVDTPWRLILKMDNKLSFYYKWWLEKEIFNPLALDDGIKLDLPLWGNHITILSGRENVLPRYQDQWKKYDREKITVEYLPDLYQVWKFWCLPVRSSRLEKIRKELGLSEFAARDKIVHPGFNFHMTVCRMK